MREDWNLNDEAICVMRHFKWDAERMSYSWFDDQDNLRRKLGLEFDNAKMSL